MRRTLTNILAPIFSNLTSLESSHNRMSPVLFHQPSTGLYSFALVALAQAAGNVTSAPERTATEYEWPKSTKPGNGFRNSPVEWAAPPL